jgi:dCMP deaminase
VHAEANAIISAARNEMIDATLYLVGKEKKDGTYVKNANSCTMCKRLIINAGIDEVIVRDDEDKYRIIKVADWIYQDETLPNGLIEEVE